MLTIIVGLAIVLALLLALLLRSRHGAAAPRGRGARGFVWGLFGLGALLFAAAIAVYLVSEVRYRQRFATPREAPRAATDSAGLARGREIARGTCAGCHGNDLGGRRFIDGMPFGRWHAPNLTAGEGGAARRMNDAELEAVIRHGVMADGRSVHFMPVEVFNHFADDDLTALLGYLRAAPPIDRTAPPPELGPIARVALTANPAGLRQAVHVVSRTSHQPRAPAVAPTVERGRYAAEINACVFCHGPGLSGGALPEGPPGAKPAANLTPAGIGTYSEADFVRAMRQGVRPNGTPIDSAAMPWPYLGRMSDVDLSALYAYLKTVPPKPFGNR